MVSVQQAKHYLHDAGDKAELGRVLQFLTDERFQRVLKLHNKLASASVQMPQQRPDDSLTSLCDAAVHSATSSRSKNTHANELVKILSDAHFKVSY